MGLFHWFERMERLESLEAENDRLLADNRQLRERLQQLDAEDIELKKQLAWERRRASEAERSRDDMRMVLRTVDQPPRPTRFADIRRWGMDRQIIQNSSAKAQFLKTVEEVGELASALAKGKIVPDAIDAIGDIVVTLTLVAACEKLDIEDCIEHSWGVIKDRKGHLTPDGVFVKEEA